MRVDANPAPLPLWRDVAALERIVAAERLAIARLEPVFTRREQGALALDLIFVRGNEIAVIPAVRVASEMLLERECSVLLWPAECAALGAERLDAIEDRILAWLLARSMAGQLNEELVRRFTGLANEADFEHARAAGFAGAATYREVATAMAPYAYARRFAAGARVGICDGQGASGAVLLARSGADVTCDLGSADRNDLASRWFGFHIFAPLSGSYDVGIETHGTRFELRFDAEGGRRVQVAAPVPSEIWVSFDVDDAPPVRTFSVICREREVLRDCALAAPSLVVGGSSGNILLLLRGDSLRDHQPDADDAAELGARLRREGFTVAIGSAADVQGDPSRFDLIHTFGIGDADDAGLLAAARASRVPVVATAQLPQVTGEATWGMGVTPALMRMSADEARVADYLAMMSLRRLNTEETAPQQREPIPGFEQNVRAQLANVDALLVSCDEEEVFVRTRFGYAGPVFRAGPYLAAGVKPEPIADLVGTADFVLVHTPIAARANLGFMARAAREVKVPLVIAGPVGDTLYFAYLRGELDGRAILLPHPAEGELTALYRRARVFADLSWWEGSLHRLARAALCGCSVLAPAASYARWLLPRIFCADVADIASIRQRLREAWDAPFDSSACATASARCDPTQTFLTTMQAYARAQGPRV